MPAINEKYDNKDQLKLHKQEHAYTHAGDKKITATCKPFTSSLSGLGL